MKRSEQDLMAKMRETWVNDEAEGESQSGSLLLLISVLSVFMIAVLGWLHFQSPQQHRYEKRQIQKLNAKLHRTKVVKRVSYLIE